MSYECHDFDLQTPMTKVGNKIIIISTTWYKENNYKEKQFIHIASEKKSSKDRQKVQHERKFRVNLTRDRSCGSNKLGLN